MAGPYNFVDVYLSTTTESTDSDIGQGNYDSEEIESSLTWEHELRIPCQKTQPESQTWPESQILGSSDSPPNSDDFESLPEADRVFRDIFGSITPPDSSFSISPKMEAGSIPKAEEDPQWFNEGIESRSVATESQGLPVAPDDERLYYWQTQPDFESQSRSVATESQGLPAAPDDEQLYYWQTQPDFEPQSLPHPKSQTKTDATSSLTSKGTRRLASRLLNELKVLDSLRMKKRRLYRRILTLSHRH